VGNLISFPSTPSPLSLSLSLSLSSLSLYCIDASAFLTDDVTGSLSLSITSRAILASTLQGTQRSLLQVASLLTRRPQRASRTNKGSFVKRGKIRLFLTYQRKSSRKRF